MYKKYNKSRLSSQSDHHIAFKQCHTMTIDGIFLDDGPAHRLMIYDGRIHMATIGDGLVRLSVMLLYY